MDAAPELNVAHLVVGNVMEGGLMACGYVMAPGDQSKFHADRGDDGECLCLPQEQWPRCQGCIEGQQASEARKAARSGGGR
jgi:hypothetical protein